MTHKCHQNPLTQKKPINIKMKNSHLIVKFGNFWFFFNKYLKKNK